MMKYLATLTLLFTTTLFTAFSAQCNQDGLGVGLTLGSPTGITGKYWLNKTDAIDAAAAWSASDDTKVYVHANYLRHDFQLIKTNQKSGKVALYYGLGAAVASKDKDDSDENTWVAVRVPVGVNYMLNSAPLNFFVEIVPALEVVPDSDFELGAALGGRYYF